MERDNERAARSDLGTKLCETVWNGQDAVEPTRRLTIIDLQF
jgi:hypothetical protein